MAALKIVSDAHLGHRSICRFRKQFSSAEEHHEIIFDNIASGVNKRDSLYLFGDIAFDKYWLNKIKAIKCAKKTLICGNHDLDFKLTMRDLVETYDAVYSLLSKKGMWFTHCPIHPQEIRKRNKVIHGHLHSSFVTTTEIVDVPDRMGRYSIQKDVIDERYINVCLEHTDWKPITIEYALSQEYMEKLKEMFEDKKNE